MALDPDAHLPGTEAHALEDPSGTASPASAGKGTWELGLSQTPRDDELRRPALAL